MRLYQSERFQRMLRRLPRGGPLAWLEIALLIGLAAALATLAWVIVTPVGPFGDWRPRHVAVLSADAQRALFARFDPFYRTTDDAGGTQAVTTLSLKLFGVRINEATGLGSAIIETPDGVQSSYAVGDEITGGVTLKAVTIDHVVLDKGGADEMLYIDQSEPAPVATPDARASIAAPVPTPSRATAEPIAVPSQPGFTTTPAGNSINFAPSAASRPPAAPAPANSMTPDR
jgi:general secretion pathway protein C